MSSLIFLGFSIITFVIAYGISWLLVPAILGQFFSAHNADAITDPEWRAIYLETEDVIKWIIPLIPTVGIFVLVLKVLLVASTRGDD